ncbi:MAG TPA: MogA/MoaB family molybdenum cofactor biosynthesis protein [Longimicrobiales bacterium]|nr:MogA/MoaB family molybdenum cofactor biosynthesis protein [Longimicrobiales bacterium]
MSGSLRIAILTVSDGVTRGDRRDESGAALESWAAEQGHVVAHRGVVPDDRAAIGPVLSDLCDSGAIDVVLTTGGTGFTDRDVTPEATMDVIERLVPGISEALRASGARQTPYAWLSRGIAGIRGRTLVVNLPGGTRAVVDGTIVLDPLLPHAVQLLRGERTQVHDHG